MADREFCKRLIALRISKGMRQSDLEKASGIPATVLSHYENGTRAPGLSSIKAIVKGLGCSASDLLDD